MRAFIIRPFGEEGRHRLRQGRSGADRPGARRASDRGRHDRRRGRGGQHPRGHVPAAPRLGSRRGRHLDRQPERLLRARHPPRAEGEAHVPDPGARDDRRRAVRPQDRSDTFRTTRPLPARRSDALCAGLQATLASDRQDSPVFRILPGLREQDAIPASCPCPASSARRWSTRPSAKMRGKLALLGQEARGSLWESEGLRLVGREQFRARAFEAAAVTLGELCAGSSRLTRKRTCCSAPSTNGWEIWRDQRRRCAGSVDHRDTSAKDRAEALSLLGRNLKTQWRESWRALVPEEPPCAGAGLAVADAVVRRLLHGVPAGSQPFLFRASMPWPC